MYALGSTLKGGTCMSTMRKSSQEVLGSQTVRFNIGGGPSRDRIFDACNMYTIRSG